MPLAVRDYPEGTVTAGTEPREESATSLRKTMPARKPRKGGTIQPTQFGDDPGKPLSTMSAHDHDDPRYPVRKSDSQWREQLDRMQYEVARHAATERAFTGKYWDHFQDGKYLCVGCGTPLFESSTKFDAGCGWPSYWEPVNSEVVERIVDKSHGMVRVEVRCNRCGSHLGHVFPDGPEPTGERFCINSAAIAFKPKQA
jgi:peptide-methionine (R)-S-oxide reductase